MSDLESEFWEFDSPLGHQTQTSSLIANLPSLHKGDALRILIKTIHELWRGGQVTRTVS